MSNALYDPGREGFLDGTINSGMKIRAYLVDTGAYTFSAAHKFLSSVASGARIAGPSPIFTTKTATNGVFDADDVTITAVTGVSIEAVVIVMAAATDGAGDLADTAQRLIAFIDTATGLPFTPNGGDVIRSWDNGALRIFKL